jgi:drug/metabolite transporter (DMT)-like permease
MPLIGLVLAVIATNSAGNFALRIGMLQVGRTVSLSPLPYLAALLNGWVLAGVFLLIGWLVLQLSLLSRADLAYALPVTAMGNVVAALLGAFVLYERVSPAGWVGIGLISTGAFLVGQTDSRTDGAGS